MRPARPLNARIVPRPPELQYLALPNGLAGRGGAVRFLLLAGGVPFKVGLVFMACLRGAYGGGGGAKADVCHRAPQNALNLQPQSATDIERHITQRLQPRLQPSIPQPPPPSIPPHT